MWLEISRLALEALGRNPLRSALTALGIMIGAGAVVVMVSIGQGATHQVSSEIGRLGAQLLTLSAGQRMRGGQGTSIAAEPFDYADLESIEANVSGLKHVAPLATRQMLAVARNVNWSVRVIGTESDYFLAREWKLSEGRYFSDLEMHNGRPLCIIGATVHERLFGGGGRGDALRIGTLPCTVIGVLARRGQSATGEDDDNTVAIPFDAFQRRIQGTPDIGAIVMAAHPGADLERIKRSIAGLMRERRNIAAGEADDFSLLDMRQVAKSMTAATETLTLFLAAIAAVSLVVGGIGIMNIMLASVTERTREIGVRIAIGALPSQVRRQFLVESVLLTFAGGAAGIAIGLAVAWSAAPAIGVPFFIDAGVIAAALAMTVLLGLSFGVVPAARASRLDPVEALRHE